MLKEEMRICQIRECRAGKRRRLDLQSDSLIDSLTCLYIITPPAACGESPMKGSSREEEQPGLSHLNNIEVISGESPMKGSSRDEETAWTVSPQQY